MLLSHPARDEIDNFLLRMRAELGVNIARMIVDRTSSDVELLLDAHSRISTSQ